MSKKSLALGAAAILCGTLSLNAEAAATQSAQIDLKFNAANFTQESVIVGGKKIKFRAYKNIIYVAKPVSAHYQSMNIFIPQQYFEGRKSGKFDATSAPIFLPNGVGGYMPGEAGEVKIDKSGKPNAIATALSRGYVVAAPAARGRTLKDANGDYIGKAPAAIVDLKAAVRYLKFNDAAMPGDANKIISNGTSAGGALSALLGASGDEAAYEPYLQELGAAKASDKIYAASAYCPITNLKHADAAYEWMFGAQSKYEKMDFSGLDAAGFNERGENSGGAEKNPKKGADQSAAKPARKTISGKLNAAQIKISDELKAQFPAYLNSLSLKDEGGRALSLDKNGDGSFKDYINGLISASFANFAAKNPRAKAPLYLAAKIKDDAPQSHMLFWGYATAEPRAKTPLAFDDFALENPENELFGSAKFNAAHFTDFGAMNDPAKGVLIADAQLVEMMDAMSFVRNENGAKFYRIRHGASDRDTALAIPVILTLSLQNAGKNVDFAVPWGQGHGGDYDLDELFSWIDEIVAR